MSVKWSGDQNDEKIEYEKKMSEYFKNPIELRWDQKDEKWGVYALIDGTFWKVRDFVSWNEVTKYYQECVKPINYKHHTH